ncbi:MULTISPECIES: alpha/beta-hydrolase family protein [unclassified Knoellia]|uniref:alpha/beta-hydrolase family protein n=1 Tax=Knoellia altitudinis TaxID=3404795 RepID=UPI00360FB993
MTLRLPRASTALATPVAVGVATFPSYLPHLPVALGVLTALSFLVVVGIARRLAGPHPRVTGPAHPLVVALGGAVTAYLLFITWTTQAGMRARIGMDPLALPDLGLLVATAAAVVGGYHGLRQLRRRRRARVPRRAVAAVAGLSLLSFAPSAQADADAPPSDQVLLTSSPVGAVRAYAGLSESADDAARARIAVDRLVAAGGLAREHLLVAIPTGSGWVNPEFVAGMERRFGSDVATVSMQYDDRPSWVAYLLDRQGAVRGAQALLDAAVAEVSTLPVGQRPQVHVVGESLGATAGQAALLAPGVAGDALRSTVCSTFWLGTPGGGRTGLPRETVAANADDPIVHARPSMALVPPGEDRPWLPVVSFVHAGADVVGALAMPFGAGHRYGADQPERLQTCD